MLRLANYHSSRSAGEGAGARLAGGAIEGEKTISA
ncbi:hypothetical protein TAMC210_15030 [Thermanaeromonas sp. C210]|nr:hypothetical protein TAMC210_15030 [Thermanaeromonas sp. C210]